jgi:hypothetical protein
MYWRVKLLKRQKKLSGKPVKSWILRLMTWLGSGGEVYIGAEGLRDGRYCTVIDEEKEKTHKTWYSSLYDKLLEKNIKNKKLKSFYVPMTRL